jgi:2,3-dihydroxybiphenyl 1,2-dioxygenase
MSLIQQLSYIIIESGKTAEWKSYAADFLGMVVNEGQPGGFMRVRMDSREYRFLIRNAEGREASEDIWAAGFLVANQEALEKLAAQVTSKGVEVHQGTAQELAERDVQAMIWFQDPQGLRIEVSCNPKDLTDDLVLPLVPGGYLTGEMGFGHIAIGAADLPKCEAFYKDVLGFKISDYIVQDIQGIPIRFTFFHVNPRHHTLALAGLPTPYRLNHVMFEVKSVDAVGLAMERAKQQGINFYMNLGRHPNDRMLSFYAFTPSNFAVEYGTGGVQIRDDDTWEVKTYNAISAWGHKD